MNKIGFIGGGNMATAILKGVVTTGTYPAEQLYVYDVDQKKAESFSALGVTPCTSIEALARTCQIIFLAIKPQNFPEALASVKDSVTVDTLFVTIAAGISTTYIQEGVGKACPVIRVMPNTPLLLGKGATALCRSPQVRDEQFALIQQIFSACGVVAVLDEAQMNAVISVNGSSPAYVYLFAKAMLDGAKAQGIAPEIALPLICQTLIGSAAMLLQEGETPEHLIQMVSSPGGTTLKALEALETNHFAEGIMEAMEACTKRAEELGK